MELFNLINMTNVIKIMTNYDYNAIFKMMWQY